MEHLLDTSVCVEMMRQGEDFDGVDLDLSSCVLSTVVRFELAYGILRAPKRLKAVLESRLRLLLGNVSCVEFDQEASLDAATIRFELERQGTPIGHYDTLIAGHARARSSSLVTGNVKEFGRVRRLKVVPLKAPAAGGDQ